MFFCKRTQRYSKQQFNYCIQFFLTFKSAPWFFSRRHILAYSFEQCSADRKAALANSEAHLVSPCRAAQCKGVCIWRQSAWDILRPGCMPLFQQRWNLTVALWTCLNVFHPPPWDLLHLDQLLLSRDTEQIFATHNWQPQKAWGCIDESSQIVEQLRVLMQSSEIILIVHLADCLVETSGVWFSFTDWSWL